MSDLAERPFHWEDLDQRLLSPKLQELAEEMQKRAADAARKAAFETSRSGNSAGYLPRLFEAQERLTDEWAKQLYDAHCEVWRIQGRPTSPAFIRAVGSKAIPELIDARKGSVESSVKLWCMRTRRSHDASALGEWTRMMWRLGGQWARRLEAEAVATEYATAKDPAGFSDRRGSLSPFEQLGGELYQEALQNAKPHGKRKVVDEVALRLIGVKLDEACFGPPTENLEKDAIRTISAHNQKFGKAAIKTWEKLATNTQYRKFMRRRLIHAKEKLERYSSEKRLRRLF